MSEVAFRVRVTHFDGFDSPNLANWIQSDCKISRLGFYGSTPLPEALRMSGEYIRLLEKRARCRRSLILESAPEVFSMKWAECSSGRERHSK